MNLTILNRTILLISFCVVNLGIWSCHSNTSAYHKSQQVSESTNWANEPIYTVIPFDKKQMYYLDLESSTDLTDDEIQKIDFLLKEYLEEYNSIVKKNIEEANQKPHRNYKIKEADHVLELNNYKRQYVSGLNEKGEKVVWINCFCGKSLKDWKESIVFVSDGGNCYFNLKLNLATESFYELRVNGVA